MVILTDIPMKRRVCIAILAMGFSGLVAEILLLREMLIVFSGNELSIGIILSNWLILEALGAFLAGRTAEKARNMPASFTLMTILFSVSLFPAVFLTRALKALIGLSVGESIGLIPMFYASWLILLPVSLLHGALFAYGCRIYAMFSAQEGTSAGRVYVYETVGAIIGGIACTYLFVPHLNTFHAVAGLALLNFAACLGLFVPSLETGSIRKSLPLLLIGLILVAGYLLFSGQISRLHRYAVKTQWQNLHVVHYQNSRYGNICVVENEGQYLFFQDGTVHLVTPVPDIPLIAEFVHLPLLAHPEPKALAILSGGAGGIINEALKHPSIRRIDYAELDPLILELLRKFPTPLTESELNDNRVRIKHMDGRLLLKSTENSYDLILIGMAEPDSLQTNRFFTREFFSLAKHRLNKEGILVLGLPGSLTFLNDELKNLNSSIYHTLKTVFPHVRAIPGDGRNLFLASDGRHITALDRQQMMERLGRRNIAAGALVFRQIEKKTHPGWQEWFTGFIQESSRKINSDFHPIGVFYSISNWNALFAPSFARIFSQFERLNLTTTALFLGGFFLLCFFLRLKRIKFGKASIPFSIITTGFAGMILELMIIFAFQSIYGYVFSWIGLLMAAFMAGAACGALFASRKTALMTKTLRLYRGIEMSIIGIAIGSPLVFLAVPAHLGGLTASIFLKMIFLLVSCIIGFIIGAQFPLANRIYLKSSPSVAQTAGFLYAADLLGGWFGGIIGAVVLLPVLGLFGAGLTVALLKLVSFMIILTQFERPLSGGLS